jgi:hypothetical protein
MIANGLTISRRSVVPREKTCENRLRSIIRTYIKPRIPLKKLHETPPPPITMEKIITSREGRLLGVTQGNSSVWFLTEGSH